MGTVCFSNVGYSHLDTVFNSRQIIRCWWRSETEKKITIFLLLMIIFVFRSHEQQSNGYDWRQDTPFWNNGVKSSRTGTSGQSSNKPQVPGNKPNLREEPWTHLHGPASLWPAGQHGYPPGLFFGRKAGVPGGANAGKYVNFNQ